MTIEHTIGPHTTLLTNYTDVDKLRATTPGPPLNDAPRSGYSPADTGHVMLSTLVTVGADEILTVTADLGSYGTVWQDGTTSQWSVGAKAPLRLPGPALYKIETVKGNVTHSVDGRDVAALVEKLPAATDRVVSERIVTAAVIDGLQARRSKPTMALAEKAKLLAARAKALPEKHGTRMDALDARLTSADSRAEVALTKIETSVVADVEASATAMEDVANQLTNAFDGVGNG